MPAMNDYAIFLTHRVDCIAGKPPPTKNVSIQQITCCLIRGGLLRDSATSETWWGLPQPAWRLALPIAQPRRSALSSLPPPP